MPQMTLEEARKDAAQHGLYTPQAEHDACVVGVGDDAAQFLGRDVRREAQQGEK